MNRLIKIFKPLLWLLLLALFIVITLPKEQLYYKLEQTILKKNEIVLYDEKVSNKLLSLNIKDTMISYKKIDAGYLQELNIFSLLFYTDITVKNLKVNKSIQNIIPADIKQLNIKHSILMPHLINLDGELKMGTLSAQANLFSRKINVTLEVKDRISSSEKRLLNFMKKSKTQKGVYTYEYSF